VELSKVNITVLKELDSLLAHLLPDTLILFLRDQELGWARWLRRGLLTGRARL
jgi:hypothetical protein